MDDILIQQELKWEENLRIWGRMLLNISDEQFQQEIREKGFGYIEFSYDVAANSFSLDATNAPETVSRYSREIISSLLTRVTMVRNYWNSNDYLRYKNVRKRIDDDETAE